jgi:oxygen-independent coproporphyrinogen-3 oxidase
MDAAPEQASTNAPKRAGTSRPRSAYVHLPFCHRRCFYCDFPIVPLGDRADGSRSASIVAYLEILHREIAGSAPGPPLSTIYLGGGTPSMLTPEQISGLIQALRSRFGIGPGAEISMELDPASFDQERLHGYLNAGVNRISLGGQSFDDAVLLALGRRHRHRDLVEATRWLRQCLAEQRLRSWSMDLIQGLPFAETRADPRKHWKEQLSQAVDSGAPHLSVYDLIVEPGTVFARRLARGELPLPGEELAADLMDLTWEGMRAAGYGHYEISNYALPGHACRHNRVYWGGGSWWGFGMGATSCLAGQRQARPRRRDDYVSWVRGGAGQTGLMEEEARGSLPVEDLLLVGLRRREGVNLRELAALQGLSHQSMEDLRGHLQPFLSQGLLLVEGDRWRLSDPAGLCLSNLVLREWLEWWERHATP